jgi:hypothetical protein
MGAEFRRPQPMQRRLVPTALLLLVFSGTACAHRGHAVWTDITWAGDRFEIVHRMHLADAISVNRFMGGREAIEAPRSLARVALYVEERFHRLPESGVDRPRFETIGAEIEDDFIFVYQEWVTDLPERFPGLTNRVLLDIEPEAQAFLRIQGPGLAEERQRVPGPAHL